LNGWKRDEAESGTENPGTSAKAADPRLPEGVLHCVKGNLFGDIETHLVTPARNPPKSPVWDDKYVSGWDAEFASAIREIGVDPGIPGPARFSRPWTLLGSRRFVGRIHSRRPARILAFHSAWTRSLQGQVVRRHRIPKAMCPHTCLPRDLMRKKWARRTALDGVAANSRFAAESAMDSRLGFAVPKVVPLPVPTPGARERLRAWIVAPDMSKLIPQASRVTRRKGLEPLIRPLFSLRLRTIWECWVAGASDSKEDCRLQPELHAIAAGGGISEGIRWLGFQSDMPNPKRAANPRCQVDDVADAFGLSWVKAMLAGLPVVGPARGGIVESLEPAGVVVVIPGDHRDPGLSPHWQLTKADQRIPSAIRGREVDPAGPEPVSRAGEHRDWLRLVSEAVTVRPKEWNSS
jgi:glycosyltransferase involved in cell wall biosynthesis